MARNRVRAGPLGPAFPLLERPDAEFVSRGELGLGHARRPPDGAHVNLGRHVGRGVRIGRDLPDDRVVGQLAGFPVRPRISSYRGGASPIAAKLLIVTAPSGKCATI